MTATQIGDIRLEHTPHKRSSSDAARGRQKRKPWWVAEPRGVKLKIAFVRRCGSKGAHEPCEIPRKLKCAVARDGTKRSPKNKEHRAAPEPFSPKFALGNAWMEFRRSGGSNPLGSTTFQRERSEFWLCSVVSISISGHRPPAILPRHTLPSKRDIITSQSQEPAVTATSFPSWKPSVFSIVTHGSPQTRIVGNAQWIRVQQGQNRASHPGGW
jgi:hypothetical protein